MTPCEPQHIADPEAFRVPATEIEHRTTSIQEQLRRAGIDGLFISKVPVEIFVCEA
jgi:hypothetical protein